MARAVHRRFIQEVLVHYRASKDLKPMVKLQTAAVTFMTFFLLSQGAWAASAQVVDGGARLRAGPGTYYRVLASVPSGTRVELINCLGKRGWCKVSLWSRRGWIHESRLATRGEDGVGADGEPIGGVSGGQVGDHVGRPGQEDAIEGGNQDYVRILGKVVDRPGY